jgi:hypothetical protein
MPKKRHTLKILVGKQDVECESEAGIKEENLSM